MNDECVEQISKYKLYMESMKRANQKYRQNNKDKLREIAKNYYNNHKNETQFIEKCREKSKRSYYKCSQIKKIQETLFVLQT